MASPNSNDYFKYFPYFPPPQTFQPPPPHPFQPPPPAAKPPSPSRSPPPPTPSHHFAPPPPHPRPLPPPHPRPLPPPHVRPPPPHVRPPPPAPSPSNHPTVIVIVFISCGGLFFLAFLAACLFCFIKRKKKTIQETDLIHVDEHREVKEAIIPGPHGSQAVILSIEDDVHIDEVIRKDEKFGEGLHAKSAEGKSGSTLEEGTSSPGFDHDYHPEHKA